MNLLTERPETHDHLEALYERYGKDTVFISLNEAAKYCKVDVRSLQSDKTFPIKIIGARDPKAKRIKQRYRVPLINFARWLGATS